MDFGYIFSQVLHFYSLTDEQVLAMPLRRFWLLQSNIARLSATQDMRTLRMKLALQDKDGFEQYREGLISELGNVQTVEEKLDREGLKQLAALA